MVLMSKLGRTRPSMEPRGGPQAGRTGYPQIQDDDSSPRAQGALGLGFQVKPKGKCGVLQALTACGPPRGSIDGLVRASFNNDAARPSRGAKPHGEDDRGLPQARPRQDGSRGGGEIKARYLTRCP